VDVEHLGVSVDSKATFLPFRGDSRFHNFALLTELLNFVTEGREIEELLGFIRESVLTPFAPQGFYIFRHWEGATWKITHLNAQTEEEITLSPNHAVATSFESGVIGLAATDGWPLELSEEAHSIPGDSYRLLLIPLIDNLVPRSVLTVVISNSRTISPPEQELFAFLQVVLSYVAYGSKQSDKAHHDL
jgi:hypothetical protein